MVANNTNHGLKWENTLLEVLTSKKAPTIPPIKETRIK